MTTTETPRQPLTRGWYERFAFGLPSGSVRAILALLILGNACALVAVRPDLPLPGYLRDLMFLILGHYFALRRAQGEPIEEGPPPLFLPRGTIRFLIIIGFITVFILLIRRGATWRPSESPAAFTLFLVAGFLLGVILRKVGGWWTARSGKRSYRLFTDLRALVTVISALVLIGLAWNEVYHFIRLRDHLPGRAGTPLNQIGLEYVFSAIVGFYFGARS